MKWKINVKAIRAQETVGTLLECLRYAGVITKLDHRYRDDKDAHGYYSFSIHAPKGTASEVWAGMNCERMRTFMIKAEPEPE